MRLELEPSLERWVEAQFLDREQADRIRQWEGERQPRAGSRWQVTMAVAFGGIMLAAGVLLFVSAHWDELSPFQRMAVLLLAVGGFHAAGAFAMERVRAVGVTLHAVGTVALGGAIAMAGQIFNMQEHWPAAVLMWAVGAAAGWLLLRDWPHMALMAILVPFWLASEWATAVPFSTALLPVIGCGVLLLAICYFTARVPGASSGTDPVRSALTWIGGLAVLPATLLVAVSHHAYWREAAGSDGWLALGWCVALMGPLAVAFALRGKHAWMNLVAVPWVVGLSLAGEARMEPTVYAFCALGAAGMVAWGIHESRAERINLGMAGFALTILFFYFSSVMDKLGRSASLILLGLLFTGGGWAWEKTRRKLVAGAALGGAQ